MVKTIGRIGNGTMEQYRRNNNRGSRWRHRREAVVNLTVGLRIRHSLKITLLFLHAWSQHYRRHSTSLECSTMAILGGIAGECHVKFTPFTDAVVPVPSLVKGGEPDNRTMDHWQWTAMLSICGCTMTAGGGRRRVIRTAFTGAGEAFSDTPLGCLFGTRLEPFLAILPFWPVPHLCHIILTVSWQRSLRTSVKSFVLLQTADWLFADLSQNEFPSAMVPQGKLQILGIAKISSKLHYSY